jgi:di/tricarboxylate transporter
MNSSIGNWLLIIGAFFIVAGLIAKTGVLGWFGHLPGDIHIRREGFQFYFPLASMIVISIALSLFISVVRKFF